MFCQNFLKDTVISSKELTVTNTDGTKVPFEQSDAASFAKSMFRGTAYALPLLMILSAIFIVGIVFASITKRRGLLWVGLTFIGTGVNLLIFYGIAGSIATLTGNSLSTATDLPAVTNAVLGFVKVVASDMRSALAGYIYAFFGIGAICLVGFFVKKRDHTLSDETPPAEQASEVKPEETPKNVEKNSKDV